MSRPCSTEFCVWIPQGSDVVNCDEEHGVTKHVSCGEDAVLCHSDWFSNIRPSITCDQDNNLIQEFDIIKNPNDGIGLKNDNNQVQHPSNQQHFYHQHPQHQAPYQYNQPTTKTRT